MQYAANANGDQPVVPCQPELPFHSTCTGQEVRFWAIQADGFRLFYFPNSSNNMIDACMDARMYVWRTRARPYPYISGQDHNNPDSLSVSSVSLEPFGWLGMPRAHSAVGNWREAGVLTLTYVVVVSWSCIAGEWNKLETRRSPRFSRRVWGQTAKPNDSGIRDPGTGNILDLLGAYMITTRSLEYLNF